MSKMCSRHFQMESWAIIFPISFLINFRTVYIWPVCQKLDNRIWFTILLSQRELHSVSNIDFFFAKLWLILSQLELSRTELPKCTRSILMENYTICPVLSILFSYDPACKTWLFKKFIFELGASYSSKITLNLVRQAIILKRNGGVTSEIYCLILWSLICTPLILVPASTKIVITSATVIYNSMRVETPGERLM